MIRGIFLLALACLAATASGNTIGSKVPLPDGRIVGGEDTTIEKFPYQISLRLYGSHICGGSIVNSRTVVTAAHCIYSISASYYSVGYGSKNVNGVKSIVAERIVKHEKYDSGVIDHDVALVFLRDNIPLSAAAQPIPLASQEPAPGTKAVVSGWGAIKENGNSPASLQKVEVDIVNADICQEAYNGVNAITPRMLCAGVTQGGKDACQGDSGGPLVANGQLVGIVSWGVGCARPQYPGVYSNVANLRPWIDSKL